MRGSRSRNTTAHSRWRAAYCFRLRQHPTHTTPLPRRPATNQRYVYASVLRKLNPSDPGHFVAHASSLQRDLRSTLQGAARSTSDRAASAEVGRLLAERAKALGDLDSVHFERARGQRFAGKLKALIESARQNGLQVK